MSNRYKGGVLSATPPTTSSSAAPGIWTLEQQMQATAGTGWPFGGPFTYIEDVFSTWLYTGTNATQTITNGIDLSGKGGLVWIKSRTSVDPGTVFDTARGATNYLFTPTTAAQATLANTLTAFNSNGFSLGTDNNIGTVNTSTTNYVSWSFREQAKFFDIVTYTGDGASDRAISHSLNAVPGCVIVKKTNAVQNWAVWHRTFTTGDHMYLNTTGAVVNNTVVFGNNANTSTTFNVGSFLNANGDTYVAYLFAHNAGGFGLTGNDNVISCGSFTTDGSGNATVNLGYEPQWVLAKASGIAQDWRVVNNMTWNFSDTRANILVPNTSAAEVDSNFYTGRPSATGFSSSGGASQPYIYIAIRRGPMKVPTVGTSVFSPFVGSDASTITTGFPVDMLFDNKRAGNSNNTVNASRLVGENSLITSSTAAETAGLVGANCFQNNTGYLPNALGTGIVAYAYQRAPSFFDVVCYTGTGSATTQTHNLGAIPELLIIKKRSSATNSNWITNYYVSASQTADGYLNLTLSLPTVAWSSSNLGSAPTATNFSVGSYSVVNESGGTFVAYLFATCAGVSKVGSYTGTATTKQIDCGFTAGARFVLIKRTDFTGDWYVWDSARGIVAGNDPYLLLNSTAAEVTGTDYVDTYNAGFELSSTAPQGINANGGTYIFLAIA